MTPRSRRAGWVRLALVLATVIAADQFSKALVEANVALGERVGVLPAVDLKRVLNDGVAFGFLGGRGSTGILLITAIALFGLLGWFALDPARHGAWVATGLICGGALGNVIDRVRQEAVTDFISLPLWPTFNLADIAITAGAVALVFAALPASGEGSPAAGHGDESREAASSEAGIGGRDRGA